MKQHKLLFSVLAVMLLASCTQDNITGNGPVISESRSVSDFQSLRSEIGADIYLTQSEDYSFRIEAEENLLGIIDTRVSNGELVIDTDYNIRTSHRIQVYISAPDFDKISISGSGNLESMNCMTLEDLELRITGSANVDFCGTADHLKVMISGSGNIDAFGLETKTANTTITGSGAVRVSVEEALTARITGSGSVYYKGDPQVDSVITGSGRVIESN